MRSPGPAGSTASPSGRVPPDDWLSGRLDGVEAELAALTEQALAALGDAVAAQRRLRSDLVRLVLLSCVGTVAVTAALCLAALVLLHANRL